MGNKNINALKSDRVISKTGEMSREINKQKSQIRFVLRHMKIPQHKYMA